MPMSEEIHCMELTVPLPRKVNTHSAVAEAHNLDWLKSHDMLRDPKAVDLYARWDIPGLASRSFPTLDPDQLCLATDLFSFYFLFDDQFDSELGFHPVEVARVCDSLVRIAHGDTGH